MKNLILAAVALCFAWNASAQFSIYTKPDPRIEKTDVTARDIEWALSAAGLHMASFTLPVDSLRPQNVNIFIEEGVRDSTRMEWCAPISLGKTYIHFLGEAGGIFGVSLDRLVICFDDTRPQSKLNIGLENGCSVFISVTHRTDMKYGLCTFPSQPFEEGRRIPLVLYASNWEDENGKPTFTYTHKLGPDSPVFTLSPHYYIVSAELQAVE